MIKTVKFYTILFLVLFIEGKISAQVYNDCITTVPVFVKAETAPKYNGEFQQYFEQGLKGSTLNYNGEIVVTFVIDSNGSSCCTKIENCNSASLSEKLKNVVDRMTGWKPATQNGYLVRFYFRLKFIFNGSDFQVAPVLLK